jgi:hypothetical protein
MVSFAQVDLQIKRNFSDSITNSYQIIIKIAEKDQAILKNFLRSSEPIQTISYDQFQKVTPKIINFFENEGYPFITIHLDSLIPSSDTLFFSLNINRDRYFIFDSIVTKGDLKISKNYIIPYLNYRNGKKYKESIIKAIPKLISEIPFAEVVLPSGVEFYEKSSTLYLFLNKKKVNQFDGIIGFAPVNQKSGKVGFTGELKLKLLNTLSYGETLDLQWRAPEPISQLLDIYMKFPFVFASPFGIDALFHLDKKDTSYIKMNVTSSILYTFKGNNFIKTFVDYTSSNTISKSNSSEENLNADLNSFSKVMYGAAIFLKELDFIYNPRKGYQFLIQGSLGTQHNDYESKRLSRYSILCDGKLYIPLYKRLVGVIGGKGGTILGKNVLINELYRLGGTNTLQGFDELSIFASSYTLGHIEVRYLYEKLSYVNIFFNGGWYEKRTILEQMQDTPYGIGIGVAFNTRAGIFNFSYALGKQLNNPISFRTGKIHFGLALTF